MRAVFEGTGMYVPPNVIDTSDVCFVAMGGGLAWSAALYRY